MPSADPIAILPRSQTAIVAQGPGKLTIQHDAPIPALASDMVMVKTAAVAINAADAKMLDYSAAPGAIHGYDFAGTIVALGDGVLASGRFAVGDRVAGYVHGMNKLRPDVGAFAEYVGATADLLLKLPDEMTFHEAAGLGVGVATTTVGLFSELGVASLDQLRAGNKVVEDRSEAEFVLVSGGSTATGTRALQLLKLAGLRPIATCSPSNIDLVTRFGAEKAFDYHSPTCATDIRAYTGNQLAYAFDCISQVDTTTLCYAALGRAGGRYVALDPPRETVTQTRAATVEPSWIMGLTLFGSKIALDGEYYRDARPQDRVFGAAAFRAVEDLLHRGLIQPHPVKIMPGGWEGVMRGVDIIRSQPPSGYKMVYTVT
ncbi:PKS_ER domain-containing protein [Penicillium ucsense]|uniref:PKS_ER domain-containing protein n=1 Tax=Penicillium ucsense TaxID=2839758 RepID=A0A8J8VYL2_9EURO|nr:PKS_ER domain-containing protein [Penicillium ucsense]KAF7733699.1 PKS_ER domain-containing protein [Penicillium ucsense]